MHKILVIRLYFLLDALHVSGYIIPSSGATFISYTSHIPVYADTSGILVIRLYFPLDALHVSDYISPPSEATFINNISPLLYAGTIRLSIVWL
jgi:hypothetical protein